MKWHKPRLSWVFLILAVICGVFMGFYMRVLRDNNPIVDPTQISLLVFYSLMALACLLIGFYLNARD